MLDGTAGCSLEQQLAPSDPDWPNALTGGLPLLFRLQRGGAGPRNGSGPAGQEEARLLPTRLAF